MTATECLRHPWLRLRPPLPSAQQQTDVMASAGAAESSQTSSSADDDATEAEMMMDSLSASPSPSPSPTPTVASAQQQQEHSFIQNLPPPPLKDDVMEQPVVINHKVPVVEEAIVVAEQVLPLIETIVREPSATATVIRSIPIAMETVQVQSAVPAAVVVHPHQVRLAVARPESIVRHHQSPSPASKEPAQVIQQSSAAAESSLSLNEPKEQNVLPVTPPPQKNPVQDRFKSSCNKMNNKTPITSHPMTTTRKSSNIEAIQNKFSNKFNNNSSKSNASYSRQSSATKKTTPTAGNASTDAANSEEVLQLTKVNLRQFVERWSSHPSSPFQLLGESSNRGTISLLISSPTVTNAPWSEPQQPLSSSSAETKEVVTQSNASAVPVSKLAQVQQQSTSASSNNNPPGATAEELIQTSTGAAADIAAAAAIEASVETAIEQTTALLKSVKESLIKQMESGTAVRDRTGARVWDRIGSGGYIGSPISHRRPTAAAIQPLQQQEQLEINETVSMDYSSSNNNNNNETTPMDEWEVHAPVAAKTFGFAKRHKTVASSKSVLVAKTEESSSMTYSLTSTVIQHQQMSSQSHNQQ